MRKIYVNLVEHCMKQKLLSGLKGNKYDKNVEKCMILESSPKVANGLLGIRKNNKNKQYKYKKSCARTQYWYQYLSNEILSTYSLGEGSSSSSLT